MENIIFLVFYPFNHFRSDRYVNIEEIALYCLDKGIQKGRAKEMNFIGDLVGAILDILYWLIWGISYFFAGVLLVAVPIYALVFIIGLFT